MNQVLTLDIGTSSCRVMLWNDQGQAQGEEPLAQIPYKMETTPDGGVFMPAETLLTHVVECFDAAFAKGSDALNSVIAVGISTFWHSLIGVDKNGEPLTPLLNWSDARAADACNSLRRRLDTAAIHARTGCVLHPSYYPAKIQWLHDSDPALFSQIARWISPSEYLTMRLFGKSLADIRVSVSIASGTGLYNHQANAWDAELLAAIGVSASHLSPLCDLADTVSGLAPEFASRWKLLSNVPFVPAVGDGACSNIGSGCDTPDRFAINLGTSGAIRAVTQGLGESVPFGLWRYRIDRVRPLIGTAFSDGGHVMQWLAKTLQLPPQDELASRLIAMPPGSHGLTFLPFLAGERGLNWNPNTRAAILGLNLDTDPVEIVRAAMEAVALQFAGAVQKLNILFPDVKEIVASGGAFAHFPFWAQMIADAIGQPLLLSAEPEATSRGAALLALETVTHLQISDLDPAISQTFAPNPENHAVYTELLAGLQAAYAKLTPTQ